MISERTFVNFSRLNSLILSYKVIGFLAVFHFFLQQFSLDFILDFRGLQLSFLGIPIL